MNKMKCPTVGDGGADAEFQGQLPKNSRDTYNLQAGLALIERGLRLLPETDKAASIMCRRLTIDQNRWLARTALSALPRNEAEVVANEALNWVQAGEPVTSFMSVRDAAASWALFASRPERCHYLAAIWGQLGDDDRRRFLGRAL